MTNRPDPTPEHPPERIDNWAAWSAEMDARLHPEHAKAVDALAADFQRLAMDRAYQAGVKTYSEHSEILKAYISQLEAVATGLAEQLDAARADATRLRERATLTEDEQRVIAVAQRYISFETTDVYPARASTRSLLAIVSRLTTHDTAPGDETR